MKNIVLICSIVLIITSFAIYFALGRCFYRKSILKMSVASKIKFILMIICPAFLIYASYVLYFKENFTFATIISLIVTVVLIVCSKY